MEIYTFNDYQGNMFSMKGTINNIMAVFILINLKFKSECKYFIDYNKDFSALFKSREKSTYAGKPLYEAWTSAFYNNTGVGLTEYIKDNVADIIGILSTAQIGNAKTYRLHERYVNNIRRICYENNTDEYCADKLFEVDRDILISDENSEAKDTVYMCRQLADLLYNTAYLLNWDEMREGNEVEIIEPDKWLKNITM